MFFDKKRVSAEPNTKELSIYDLRTNQRFTLKERPMVRTDLDDLVACYKSGRRHERAETERVRRFTHAELVVRDKVISTSSGSGTTRSTTPTCYRLPTRSRPKSSRTWKQRSTASVRSR